MNKIIILLLINCSLALGVLGQTTTVTIDDYEKTPGLVDIDVDMTNFNNVGAISLFVKYDETVLTYSNWSSTILTGVIVNTYPVTGGYMLGVSWIDEYGISPPDGTLLTIEFNYLGGTSAFDFQEAMCEITDPDAIPFPVVYFDGSISPDETVPVIIEDKLNQTPGSTILVPIDADFSSVVAGVGSFNFEIAYDDTKLAFQQILNPFETGITVNLLSNPSRIAIVWFTEDPFGSNQNGKLLDMEFNYLGGNTELTFETAACEIADYNAAVLNASYQNGTITQDPSTMPNIIINSTTASAGSPVSIPVTVENFGISGDFDIGSFDYEITFDPLALGYVSVTGLHPLLGLGGSFSANSTGNTINVAWFSTSTSGVIIPDGQPIFTVNFDYFGTDTEVSFIESNCNMADFDANTLNAYYVNGTITEIPGSNATICMEEVVGQQLNYVLMPVYATGLDNIGAITLEMAFDPALASYVSLQNESSELTGSGSSFYNSVGGLFTYSWTITGTPGAGVDITDGTKLFEIEFYYITGTADIEFNNFNCEVSDYDAIPLNVFYCDGVIRPGIEVELKVFLEGLFNSGTGEMNKTQDFVGGFIVDKFPGTVADLIDVELHDQTDYSTIVHTVTDVELNQDGTTFFEVPEQYTGSYWVTVKTRNHIETVSANIINFATGAIIYDFTTAATQAYEGNQKLLSGGVYGIYAGDVDQNGGVDLTDRNAINDHYQVTVKGYNATDLNGDGVTNNADRNIANDGYQLTILSKQPN